MKQVLEEYVRLMLGSLNEAGDRGFAYEGSLIAALEAGGIEVSPAAGNNNTISDLGFSIDGVPYGAEVKLSSTDNLGAVRKNNFLSLSWNGEAFEGMADPESELFELAKSLIKAMNENEQMKGKMKTLEEYLGDLAPLPWNLLSSMGDDRGNSRQRAIYSIMRSEPKRFPLPKGMEPLPPGTKQLSGPASTIIDAETIRRIISGKKAPNGADTDYIIIGAGRVDAIGSLYHLGNDPLGTGAPMYDPGDVGVEIRWGGAGGEGAGRRFSFNFKTKAVGKTSPGLPFGSGEELVSILTGGASKPKKKTLKPKTIKRK